MVQPKKIALVIPAYNEEATIAATIIDFATHYPDFFIYVIDNNSTDKTSEVARDAFLSHLPEGKGEILFAPLQGKAEAVRKAFREIEADYYVMVDADNTYHAEDLGPLLDVVCSGNADMALGNRFVRGGYEKNISRPFHQIGNRLVCFLINFLFKAKLNDIMTGLRVFSKEFVKSYPILSHGFEIETEMTIFALDHAFVIKEYPIDYYDRIAGSHSKLKTYSDGLRVLKTVFIIFKDYRPLPFFLFLSCFSLFLALVFGFPVIWEYWQTRWVSHVPLAVLATGLSLFALLFFAIGLILDTVAKNHRFLCELIRMSSTKK